MKLTWSSGDDDRTGKYIHLFLGDQEDAVAYVVRAKKWWELIILLPGCSPAKRYAPLEVQKADAERQVRAWFDMAWADAPRAEVTHMAEIRWDNKLITPEGCLQDAIDQIHAGNIKPNKLLVLALYGDDVDYDVSHFVSNMKASELVTLCEHGKATFLDYLRGL